MKLSILHITLCYCILLSPISYVFTENLDNEAIKRVALTLTTSDDCASVSPFAAMFNKVQQGLEDTINESLNAAQQQSHKQATYQKLQNHFLPTQLLKNAETSGSHFTAVPMFFAFTSRLFLNSRQYQGGYLSYIAPSLTQNLHRIFEVYLI